MLCSYTSEDTLTMIMMTDNLATKITINNLQIPLCRHYEIRKDSKFVKNFVFSKMKLTSLLMKKRDSFPSKICPVF